MSGLTYDSELKMNLPQRDQYQCQKNMIDTMPSLHPDRNWNRDHFHQNQRELDTYIYILWVMAMNVSFFSDSIRPSSLDPWFLSNPFSEILLRLADSFQIFLVVWRYFSA